MAFHLIACKPAFEFGLVETPIIRGFECTPREGEWLMATQGFNKFFVERVRGGHRLFPLRLRYLRILSTGENVVYKECVCTDQAIFIPTDKP